MSLNKTKMCPEVRESVENIWQYRLVQGMWNITEWSKPREQPPVACLLWRRTAARRPSTTHDDRLHVAHNSPATACAGARPLWSCVVAVTLDLSAIQLVGLVYFYCAMPCIPLTRAHVGVQQ